MAKIKLRRDTAANWLSVNPVLALGEPGYNTTDNKIKIGDGTSTWTQLDYLTDESSGNPFDQSLNTTSSVTFNSLGVATVNVSQINGTNPGNELVIQANNNNWTFNSIGHVQFPDGSVQVTAYTGIGNDNIWIETFASDAPATDFVQGATSVEYDADGNIIALFNHYESGTDWTYTSVAKLTPTGAVLWQVRFSANLNTDGWGMAYDTVDNYVYIAGRTSGTPLTYEFATLTKLNGLNGSIVWSKTYDFEADSSSAVVDIDGDGNPIMVGYAYNGTDNYIVTTKINQADGTVVWSKTLDGQGYDEAYGMAIGPANEIVTIGYVDTFGVQDAAATLYSDPVSNANWTSTLNSISVDGLTADFEFVAGVPTFTNVVDLAGGRLPDAVLITVDGGQLGGVTGVDDMIVKVGTLAANDFKNRIVVIKYATDGTIAWQKAVQFDAGYDCFGADADIDSDGNIYVCGSYQYDIGGGNTDSAMSLVKFNSSGVKQWSRRVVGNCQTFATSVVVGDDGQLYLSGVTGNNSTSDFIWVVAKYTTDGVVTWQRLIDNTTTWTFGGALWFSSTGGSNIAVKNGYVALAGSFGDPGTQPIAVVVQIDTAATPFSVGDWDIKGASFSGLLNGSASDITVVDANKPVATVSPAVGTFASGEDLSNFLTITRYSNSGGGTGDVTFIENTIIGTGSNDGYLGLNLAPGPDLASDMYFRIHGGDVPTHLHLSVGNTSVYDQYFGTDGKYLKLGLDDNISIGTSGNVWTFNTNSSLTIPGNIDSVNSIGIQAGDAVNISSNSTVAAKIWTFDEAGDLIVPGGIKTQLSNNLSIETESLPTDPPATIVISGADFGSVNLTYIKDVANSIWYPAGYIPGTDPYIEFTGGQYGIRVPGFGQALYVNTGTLNVPLAQWNTNPPLGSVAPTGVYTYPGTYTHAWTFGTDGKLTLPFSGSPSIAVIQCSSPISLNSGDSFWTFSYDGSLTLPGPVNNISVGTVARTSFSTPVTLNDSTYLTAIVDGSYGPFTLSQVVFTVVVTSGVAAYTITSFSTSTNYTLNQVIGTLDAGDLGGTPGNTSNIAVASVTPSIVALDLTKTVNKLSDGVYTLADGVEGQIMYLVRQTGALAANITVTVAHGRRDGVAYTNIDHYAFDLGPGGTVDIDTLIFTDGAWQSMGGTWD